MFTPEEFEALLNQAEAQHHLATCYEKGLGVEVNAKKTQQWKEKALAQGFEPPSEEATRDADAQK